MASITGFHAIEEALRTASGSGAVLYLARDAGPDKRLKGLEELARSTGRVFVKKLPLREIDRMAPQGAGSRGALLDMGSSRGGGAPGDVSVGGVCAGLESGQGALVLILDGVTDPHNIGAALRSCDQFGCSLVIVPRRGSGQVNETVLRVSSGAARYVPVARVANLARGIATLKENGFWIYGADMGGEPIDQTSFAPRTAFVMGSEGAGLSRLVASSCDKIVSIPMRGHIDSLNVSVAAGILMYEFRRGR